MIELCIRIKNEDHTLKVKHLLYSEVVISKTDGTLQKLVEEAMKDFKGDIDEVTLSFKYSW